MKPRIFELRAVIRLFVKEFVDGLVEFKRHFRLCAVIIIETMKPNLRNHQTDEDYWRIREFLREVSLHTPAPGAGAGDNRHDFSWSPLPWDYWRWWRLKV